ncbi:MAG TPA: hypothetical protein VES38_08105 [Methylotenera sp.]|nr:hypothetical protein [Methylotenera sp.]
MRTGLDLKYIIAILALVGVGGWWFFNVVDDSKNTLTPAEALLVKTGDKCAGIAENSIANQAPIVEFQKLELLSRRTRVLTNCMHDNGYGQNPLWLTYAQPIAKANAHTEKVSFDEALTSFSRAEMQVFEPSTKHPPYWVKTN